jgi:hypothetical protein
VSKPVTHDRNPGGAASLVLRSPAYKLSAPDAHSLLLNDPEAMGQRIAGEQRQQAPEDIEHVGLVLSPEP